MHHVHEGSRCCVVRDLREGKVFLLVCVCVCMCLAPNFTPIR